MTTKTKKQTAIDRVRAAYLGNRQSITVAEWGLTLHFGPLTSEDTTLIAELDPQNTVQQGVALLVALAEDEAGERIFSATDYPELCRSVSTGTLNSILAVIDDVLEKQQKGGD